MTVPSELQTTSIVNEVPEEADGVNEQSVAVPEFRKSPDPRSLTVSVNERVSS